MKKTSLSRKVFMVFLYTLFVLVCLICVLPFVHLFAISLSGSTAVTAGKVTFIPVDFTLFSYEFALRGGKFLKAFGYSVVLVIVGTLINLVLMILTAYPLAKSSHKLWGRNVIMFYFIITMLFNGGIIPTYLVVSKMGLKDSLWALILPGALPVYNMVILMNFIRGLPEELQESAKLDGANEFQVLGKIVLPLLKPALATVGLFCMVGHWNNWFGGIIYMNDPSRYPLASYLQTLLVDFTTLMQSVGADYAQLISQMNQQTGRAAQLFLAMIPMLIAYPFLQKYFTSGLTLGSVKG